MLEIIFCAKQELITRARLRVQDFATGKNFSFNQCRYKEFCVFFSRKSCYKSNGKFFFCVCIAWYKHSRGWENSQQLCKPSTSSRVCITVSNSPNASNDYIRLCKHRKKDFYRFYKITFPRKNAKLFGWQWLKEKFLPVAKSCPPSLARVISCLLYTSPSPRD